MLSKLALSALALAPAVTAIETHNGIDYELRSKPDAEPWEGPILEPFEKAASKQAAERLHKRIEEKKFETDCVDKHPGTEPADLFDLKDCLTADDPEVFLHLLEDDLQEADAFWEKVVEESSKPRPEWHSTSVYVKAYFGGDLKAVEFATWMGTPKLSDPAYLRGNAEHYFKKTQNDSPTSQRAHFVDGWGGVHSEKWGTKLVNFTVPALAVPDIGSEDFPEEWAIDEAFRRTERAGFKTLSSGTKWGVLHIAARDFEASEGTTGESGVELYAGLHYPPWDLGSEEDQDEFNNRFLKDEEHHILTELVHWSQQAYKDCQNNTCIPPSS